MWTWETEFQSKLIINLIKCTTHNLSTLTSIILITKNTAQTGAKLEVSYSGGMR